MELTYASPEIANIVPKCETHLEWLNYLSQL